MTGRERVSAALAGLTPDRVPVALGFSEVEPEHVLPPGRIDGEPVDVRFVGLSPSRSMDRFRRRALPRRPDTRLGTPAQAEHYARWRYRPERLRRQNPLARVRSVRDIERLRFPETEGSAEAARALTERVAAFHARGLAVGGALPHLGGELFESAWRLRGLESFLLDLAERPAWADALLDRLTDLAIGNTRLLASAGIDVLSLGDDVGMPGGLMLSPTTWRRFLGPRMAAIIAAARAANPAIRVLYHSDGAFDAILPDLLEIGVDAVNPVQPEHMDAEAIRKRFGTRLALWGTVGTQTAFATARPEAIRREVAERLRVLGKGGLVLAPAYDVDTPEIVKENLAALIEAVRELG
jgi:uroporphyrinogen decarboxylase